MDVARSIVTGVEEGLANQEQKKGREMDGLLELVTLLKSECETTSIVPIQEDLDEIYTKREAFKQISEEMNKTENDINRMQQQIKEESQPCRSDEHIKHRDLFQRYCGLEFKVVDNNSIMLNFTNIDPNDPNRHFSVNLSLKEKWTLTSAMPEDDGIQLLVNELNETNDFHTFCKKLRALYQQNFH